MRIMIKSKKKLLIGIVLGIFVFSLGLFVFFSNKLSANFNPPNIIKISVSPDKIVSGNQMKIEAEINDEAGIKEVKAEVFNEIGFDKVEMKLISGDIRAGKWEGIWIAHDVKTKEYDLIVAVKNKSGLTAQKTIRYLDPSWLTNWSYRKQVTVSNASADYQTKVLVGESSGATGEEVDCNSHVKTDFSDLRFTSSDGETLLDYWIESITGTTPNQLATIWVQNNATPDTTLYMYYGKADATAVSSGTNTFIVFDDFERGNNGDPIGGSWTIAGGDVDISTEQAYGGTRSMKLIGTAAQPYAYIPATASGSIAINFRMYKETAATAYARQGNGTYLFSTRYFSDEVIGFYDGAAYVSTGDSCAADAWFNIELNNFVWAAATMDIFYNGASIQDNADVSWVLALNTNQLAFFSGAVAGQDAWVDNVFVRKWVATEPTWGVWGSEESQSYIPRPPAINPGGAPFIF